MEVSDETKLAARKAVDISAKALIKNDLVKEIKDLSDDTKLSKVEAENAEIMELKSLSSSVTYPNIFPGADLEYLVTPSKIKESIIVKEAQDEYTYLFDLSLGGLIPVPQEDGSICLFENAADEKPVFVLEAPYMYDAAGEASKELIMSLAQDGTLTLTADATWINDDSRVLPVILAMRC